jgi:hypothetical protein
MGQMFDKFRAPALSALLAPARRFLDILIERGAIDRRAAKAFALGLPDREEKTCA